MERSHYVLRKYSKASLDTDSVTVSLFVIFCDEATNQENPIYNLELVDDGDDNNDDDEEEDNDDNDDEEDENREEDYFQIR